MNTDGTRVGHEAKAVQLADSLAADGDAARFIQGQAGELIVAQMLHQDRSTPVDETLSESFVQRIGQAVFHRAGQALPVRAIAGPALAVGGIGIGADLRQPSRQGGDIAFGHIGAGDLARQPIIGNVGLAAEEQEDALDQFDMLVGGELAEVG